MKSIARRQRVLTVLYAASVLFATAPSTPAAETPSDLGILPASVLRSQAIELTTTEISATASAGWRGLVCKAKACELRPIRLDVEKLQDQERLRISYPATGRRAPVKGEFTIALVSGMAGTGKLAVPTWFTLRTPRDAQDAVNGSLGVTIHTADHGDYHIVPRWHQDAQDKWLTLYLETKGRRQRLGVISLDAVNAGLKPSDILIWAGDIDGDGKLDLITRAGANADARGLHLWLSSRAQPNQMVGLAASLENWTDVEEAEGC